MGRQGKALKLYCEYTFLFNFIGSMKMSYQHKNYKLGYTLDLGHQNFPNIERTKPGPSWALTFPLVSDLFLPLLPSWLVPSQRLCLGFIPNDGSDGWLQKFQRSTFEPQGVIAGGHAPHGAQHIWLIFGGASRCEEVPDVLMHLHPGARTIL